MAKMVYTEAYIEDIARAIREKNRRTNKYTVAEMGPAIRSLGGCLMETKVIIRTSEYTSGSLEVN